MPFLGNFNEKRVKVSFGASLCVHVLMIYFILAVMKPGGVDEQEYQLDNISLEEQIEEEIKIIKKKKLYHPVSTQATTPKKKSPSVKIKTRIFTPNIFYLFTMLYLLHHQLNSSCSLLHHHHHQQYNHHLGGSHPLQ